MTEAPKFHTCAEVAEMLQCSPRTIERIAARDASFPATRLSGRLRRVERAALGRWLVARTQRKRSSP